MNYLNTLMLLFGFVCVLSANATEYGVVRTPTPVLNTTDFRAVFGGISGQELKTDSCGQVRELEYIALPGSVFVLQAKVHSDSGDVYQIETDDYEAPPNIRLYVDGRSLDVVHTAPPSRRPVLPPRKEVLLALRATVGEAYVWGGNIPGGVSGLASWFSPGSEGGVASRPVLAGLDCSGLLYHATDGWTPRNTSQLISFGQGVAIAGKRPSEIADILQPLDLIVWNGHVIIVLDRHNAIESRLACGSPGNGGVVVSRLQLRITELMKTRHPINAWPNGQKRQDSFVVRRWYP